MESTMKSWIVWVLFGILFLYNMLDAHLTKLLGIVAPDQTYEANPLMAFFINNFGINSIFYVKIFVFLVVGFFLLKCQKQYQKKGLINETIKTNL